MAHLKASRAHRARRNGLVQKYFDAKKAQGVTAKAVAAAKKVRVTATGKWRAAQAVDRKASAYSAKMLAAKNKRNTELSAAKSQ